MEPALTEVCEPPPPGAGEVLCRTLQLGICGTDRDILESQAPLVPHGERQLILGHECLARIEQCGDGVGEFCEGDLVVPVVRRPLPVPEPADTLRYRPDLLAFGQYTERGIVREHGFSVPFWLDRPEHLFSVPERLAGVAVLAEPFSVAEKGINEAMAVQRSRLGAAEWAPRPPRVLVTGMGPIGFAAVAACRCRNWPVVLYGRDAEDSFRATLASLWGATYVRAERFASPPLDVEQDGFDLILECTGSDDVVLCCSSWLASRGVMVWLGSSRQPRPSRHNVALVMRNAIVRNHVYIGCVNAAARDFADALNHLDQLHRSHQAALESLLTARVGMEESLWHYRQREKQGIKTVIVYA